MKLFNLVALAGACAAYDTSKVRVDLYYESQCPACRSQITTNFAKALGTKGFGQMAIVKLHPYGNAKESQSNEENGEWNFTCQHGVAECEYNFMETCALYLLHDKKTFKQSQHQAFWFIKCVEGDDTGVNYQDVANKCGKEAKIADTVVADIMTCMRGPAGNALEHKEALLIGALNPPHTYVPYFVVDGVHSDAIQNAAGSNLLGYVCQNYKGAHKAAACSQEFEFSTEDMDVCYADNIVFPMVDADVESFL